MNFNPRAVEVVEPSDITRPGISVRSYQKRQSASERFWEALRVLAFIVRQRVVFVSVLVTGLIAGSALLKIMPKTYEAVAHVLIVASNTGRDPSVTSVDLPSVATSTEVLRNVVQKLNLPMDLLRLKQSLKATVKPKSSIVEIDYRDNLAYRAVAVPNAVADELVTYYDSISSRGADVTVRKLDRAIAGVQQRLQAINDAAAKQRKLHPFVQADKALDDATSRLDDLTSQRKLAQANLAADVAQRDAVSGDPATENRTVRYEKLQNDPMYRDLASSIAKDEAALAVDKTTFTEEHPVVGALEKKLSAERAMSAAHRNSTLSSSDAFSGTEAATALGVRKANAAVTGDRARLAGIVSLIAVANARLRDILSVGVSAERLRLQHDAARADYLTLTARRAATVASGAEALSLGSLVVYDRAVRSDTTVVGLGTARLGSLMALLALAFAVATAFIVDAFDSRLRRGDQIERLYGVPLVALIDEQS